MKKLIPIVAILFSLSSCIEIIEEIHINQDKSGKLSYRLESSQIGFIINKLSSYFEVSYEDQLKGKVEELAILLNQQEGINNVEFNIASNSMDYELSCEFSDSKTLNTALYRVFGYKKTILTPSYLKVTNSRIKRTNFSPMFKKYLEDEGIEIPSDYLSDIIYFKTYIHLPKEVKKVKGSGAEIMTKKNLVSQTFKLTDVTENKVNVGIKIKY